MQTDTQQGPVLPPAPAAPSGKRTWPWIVGIIVAFLLGVGVGAVGTMEEDEGQPVAAPQATAVPQPTTSPEVPTTAPDPSPPPEPAFRLARDDVELSLKLTEHSCYGSAGGLDTVEVRLALANRDLLPSDGEWDVTYRITGDEGGPLIGTFSLSGNGRYEVDEQVVSTPSCSTTPAVKVVSVERTL